MNEVFGSYWLGNLAALITAMATFVLAVAACIGLYTWRRELVGKSQYELANEILKATLIYRNTLARVRAAEIDAAELTEQEELRKQWSEQLKEQEKVEFELRKERFKRITDFHTEQNQEVTQQRKAETKELDERIRALSDLQSWHLLLEVRLARATNARKFLDGLLLEGEVFISDDIHNVAQELDELYTQLVEAFYVWREERRYLANPPPFGDKRDEELLKIFGKERVVARGWPLLKKIGDGRDTFDDQLEAATITIKTRLSPFTHRSKRVVRKS